MIELRPAQIQLNAPAADKVTAIRAAGKLLTDNGNIDPRYLDSMFGREEVANTYLGNGIAIPHGLPKDRDYILETGICVVQSRAGVTWKGGETAHLIVGIAAKSDEHITVLRRLTRVLGNQELVHKLIHTDDSADIIEALTGERPAPATPTVPDYDQKFSATITNAHGLHARPATNFVTLAKQFAASVRVRNGNEVADGKNMLSLLQLGVAGGDEVVVSAEGEDAPAALAALQAGIAEGLGDEEEEESVVKGTLAWKPAHVAKTFDGVAAANGLAIGIIQQHAPQAISVEDNPSDRILEGELLQNALTEAKDELVNVYNEVKTRLGAGKAAIFQAHSELLSDPALVQATVRRIFQGHSAAWAWQQVINERVEQMAKLDDPVLAARSADLSDAGNRVLRKMLNLPSPDLISSDQPVILIADDLTPSDTAALDTDSVLGFCTAAGGPTAHTAIIARSLGIPAVVATGESVLDIPNGTACILDGFNGKLYLEPSSADVVAAQQAQTNQQQLKNAAYADRLQPANTTDGHHVEVAANVNRASDAKVAIENGAEGVGLMRTEFLFLERDSAPTEDEQYEAYKGMVEALDGRPLIIRTLDIGGDKNVDYLGMTDLDNSFLGLRGIRLCLARPNLFVTQLRAIYRAAAHGSLQIMFPMIATLADFEQAKAMANMVRAELNAPEVPLGMMVEVPSAVVLADQFAATVDFFSVGTNDLTQYVLAMDRLHPQLAKRTDSLHPAVLRMIDQTVKAAQKHGKWVGVCGGVAGETAGAVLLTGLGVNELSVSSPDVATIKAEIRSRSLAEMQALAQEALNCRNAADVRKLVQ